MKEFVDEIVVKNGDLMVDIISALEQLTNRDGSPRYDIELYPDRRDLDIVRNREERNTVIKVFRNISFKGEKV